MNCRRRVLRGYNLRNSTGYQDNTACLPERDRQYWPTGEPDTLKMLRRIAKNVGPRAIRKFIRTLRGLDPHDALPPQQLFQAIYRDKIWGQGTDMTMEFHSGPGSHDEAVVAPYVAAVSQWAGGFDRKLNAVDLGCGDFSVGGKLRDKFDTYVACDIVPEVIDFNRRRYGDSNVDFQVLDMSTETLPAGDVVFIRQVFQHLSNALIQRTLRKLLQTYDHLILTEHLPAGDDFVANIDAPNGPGTRQAVKSGIWVTKPPFDLQVVTEDVLCDAELDGSIIRTTAYRLR